MLCSADSWRLSNHRWHAHGCCGKSNGRNISKRAAEHTRSYDTHDLRHFEDDPVTRFKSLPACIYSTLNICAPPLRSAAELMTMLQRSAMTELEVCSGRCFAVL